MAPHLPVRLKDLPGLHAPLALECEPIAGILHLHRIAHTLWDALGLTSGGWLRAPAQLEGGEEAAFRAVDGG
jgi:hypothetical protein